MTAQPLLPPHVTGVLTSLLEERTGQQLTAYRSWRFDIALKPLLKGRNLRDLDALVDLLLDGHDEALAGEVVDCLLNNESSFFRDAPLFDLVAQAVAAVEAKGRRARIWCAGCATGQEPLSLAMLFADAAGVSGRQLPEIVATDVSDGALARARAGRYTQFEVQRGLPIRRLMQWFDGAPDGDWIAKPELIRMIHYRRANLVTDPAPAGRFDVVLCRNVLLYLSPQVKPAVFAHLAGALRPDGLFAMGAGETVIGQTELFALSRSVRGLYALAGPGEATLAA